MDRGGSVKLTSFIHFPHVGIDKGNSSPSLFPRLELGHVLRPDNVSLVHDTRQVEDPVAVIRADKLEIVPPNELEDDPVGRVVGDPGLLVLLDLPEDPPGRHAARRQPGAELGGVVHP